MRQNWVLYKDLLRRQSVHKRLDEIARSKVEYKAEGDADGEGRQGAPEYSQQQEGEAQANENGNKTC